MMLIVLVKAAATLATSLVGFASLRNMAETHRILLSTTDDATLATHGNSRYKLQAPAVFQKHSNNRGKNSILHQYISVPNPTGKCVIHIPTDKKDHDVIHDLKQMSRKDLITLFLHCDVPNDIDEIRGDWDGILLSNNFILVSEYHG
jgi:hypothetical protein